MICSLVCFATWACWCVGYFESVQICIYVPMSRDHEQRLITAQHTTLTRDKHPCPPVRFEPTIAASERGADLCLRQCDYRHRPIFDLWTQIYSLMLTNMLCVIREFVLLHRVAWETGLLLKCSVKQERNVYFVLYPQWATCFGSSRNHQATILNNSYWKAIHIWHQLITTVKQY